MLLENFFQLTSCLSYIFLGSASIYFITYSNVLGKYMAERSATIEYEEMYDRERPVITVQFVPSTGDKDLTMEKDFNLSFWMLKEYEEGKIIDLNYGTNKYFVDNFTSGSIKVEEVKDVKDMTILKITTHSGISKENMIKEFHGFQFIFDNSTLGLENLRVSFKLTSKDNFVSYGGPFYDGEPLVQNIYAGQWKTLEIQPIRSHYLNLKRSSCREEPFIKSVFQDFSKRNIGECSKKCNPMEIGSVYHDMIDKDIPNCETEKDKECMDIYIKENIIKDMVTKPCLKFQFSGKILNENFNDRNGNQVTLWYHFAPPGLMIVKEEYLIYDLISMIGSVGGTLGLCVGFSFFGLIDFLLASLKMFILKYFKSGSVEPNNIITVKESEVESSNVEITKILQTEEFQNCLREGIGLAMKTISKQDVKF